MPLSLIPAFGLLSGDLNPRDAHKTAFNSRSGAYQWKVLPMGLCISASTFQRLINLVLAGLTYTLCLVYLDDIIRMASSLDEHLQRLEAVFQRIRAAKLTLIPDKCKILRREVTYLGHVVSERGIAIDEKKLDVVRNWETPRCLKDVRAYIGFCQYYRRFIFQFSAIARPLPELTRKNVKFVWTPKCQASFDELKEKLTSAPVVSLPRDEGEFCLDTDASGWSIGAVLSQTQDDEERVIANGSRLFFRSEMNYCTTRRELLAVVYFTKYFKQYLLGRKFEIRTDHAALQWLRQIPEPIGQQARWLEQLAPFDFEIQHRPGLKHGNADGFSRIPCKQCGVADEEHVDLVAPGNQVLGLNFSRETLVKEQEKDRGIRETMELLRQFPDQKPNWADLNGFSKFSKILWTFWSELKVIDDVLYREAINKITQEKELRLIVPQTLRTNLLRLVHEGVTGGHAGISHTKDQVRRRAFWPGWTKTVEWYVEACPQCARYQRGHAPKQGQLKALIPSRPFETISVDTTGPHPLSSKGYVFILTVVDHFSKFAFAFPMRNQEANTVARILVDHVFCLVGTPLRLLTDQGPNFESLLFKELCRILKIEKLRTSPYESSSNGQVERFHLTINSILAKNVEKNQRDWDEHLQKAVAAYRVSRHTSMSFSPNYIVFGAENVMPADLILCNPSVMPDGDNTPVEFVAKQHERFRQAYQIGRDRLKVTAQKRKSYYDLGVHAKQFPVGSSV